MAIFYFLSYERFLPVERIQHQAAKFILNDYTMDYNTRLSLLNNYVTFNAAIYARASWCYVSIKISKHTLYWQFQ